MTEIELAQQVPVWEMPPDWQSWVLYLSAFGAFAVVGLGIRLAIRTKDWYPVALVVAGTLTVMQEPMIARMAGASHAQIGQITAFVSEGRAIPWHIVFMYMPYYTLSFLYLVPKLEKHEVSAKFLWIFFLSFVIGAWILEAPFIRAGMWDYFGPQSLKPFDAMPIYFAFVNAAGALLGCAVLAKIMPLFSGLSRLWVILLGPAFTIGAHFALTYPVYNGRTSEWPIIGSHTGAAVTVMMCILGIHMMVKIFSRDKAMSDLGV